MEIDIGYLYYLDSIRNRYISLLYVAEKYKMYELSSIVVNNNGDYLQYVPDDQVICDTAIINYPWAYAYTPNKFKNYNNSLLMVKGTSQPHLSRIYRPLNLYMNVVV